MNKLLMYFIFFVRSGADKAAVEVQPDETVKEKEEELFTLDEYKAKQEKVRMCWKCKLCLQNYLSVLMQQQ